MKNERKNAARQSRVKATKKVLDVQGGSAYFNNVKWSQLFELIENINCPFTYKTVLEEGFRSCSFVRELAHSSALLDDTGDFIEFLEIQKLRIGKNEKVVAYLNEKKIFYESIDDDLIIYAYSS